MRGCQHCDPRCTIPARMRGCNTNSFDAGQHLLAAAFDAACTDRVSDEQGAIGTWSGQEVVEGNAIAFEGFVPLQTKVGWWLAPT